MAVLSDDDVRRLASLRSEQPIISCYLDVDGRRHVRPQDYQRELEVLLRRARASVNGDRVVREDLDRIETFVRSGIDRSATRGLAIFACGPHIFEVVELPVPVRSQIVVNRVPAVAQLERLLEESERFAVLLVDKQRTRLFVFRLGELVEHDEDVDELPRDYDARDEKARGGIDHHVDELVHQHVRVAAGRAFARFRAEPFDHLAIGVPDELASDLEKALHPYLTERLYARVDLTPTATLDQIRASAIALEARVEREREARLVADLREAVARNGKAVAGLGPVLEALSDRRLQRLLVSAGYADGGWHCAGCDALAAVGPSCRRCGEAMTQVVDIVEEAVEDALVQGCHVEVCVDNADLDVLGRIGATLRY